MGGVIIPDRHEQARYLLLEFKINVARHRWAVAEMKSQHSNLTSAEHLIFCEMIQEARTECQRLWLEFLAWLDLGQGPPRFARHG
jgi:hypothetical protein